MVYEIVYSETAAKQIEKLPKDVQHRIASTLERIRVRPHRYVMRLVGSPYFRLRIGDYRVILDILEKTVRIFVIEVGYKKNGL